MIHPGIYPGAYVRKRFYVKAVKVNRKNMSAVADWCDGKVVGGEEANCPYIKIKVERPQTERMTRAYVSDWVVRGPNGGFKVYRDKAFGEWFEPTADRKLESVRELVRKALLEQHRITLECADYTSGIAIHHDLSQRAGNIAREIVGLF